MPSCNRKQSDGLQSCRSSLKIPKALPKEQKKVLSQQQRSWICNTPHRMQLFAMIALYAGLRRGEALALNWSDIDLEKEL